MRLISSKDANSQMIGVKVDEWLHLHYVLLFKFVRLLEISSKSIIGVFLFLLIET